MYLSGRHHAALHRPNYILITQRRGFVLEFHLPHYVLRRDKRQFHDARGLRKHRYFRPPSEDEQNCIYEAQLSLIILGEDDFCWTAYFCGDSYFTGGNPVHRYLQDQTDGPTGALRACNRPIWDPRYYFLAVLSTRMEQVTMEWTALVQFMEDYLDPHVRFSSPPTVLQCLRGTCTYLIHLKP